MKKFSILILLLIFGESNLFSQENPQYYQTANQRYTIELHEGGCVLYELTGYGTLIAVYDLKPERKFLNPSDSIGMLFSNQFFAVSYDYKYFRVLKLKHGKAKDRNTYVARSLKDPGKVFEAVNREYWYTVYEKTSDELKYNFPMFYDYRYDSRARTWSGLSFKQVSPGEFEILANARNLELKDSLTKTNRYCQSLLDSVEIRMKSMNLEEWQSTYTKFPLNDYMYSEYVQEAINAVAEERPELFFELAETLPTEKEYLFSKIYSKEVNKALKNYQTNAPVKKEYFRYKRRTNFKTGLIMTGITILEVGIATGLISLIFI
ncbi:hypothetical protein [Fluviicola sp.]|uniref:hypothetical protein n=1 Tax=Fluviicola sp. TaxID=1917219 RepID=UPI0026157AB8|nr:hypothetical protein [Fluviicola sp.]